MYDRYVGIELSKVNNIMKRNFRKFEEIDDSNDELTGKNGWIIGYIAENKDNQFVIRRSTVSGILKLMEKKGYIIREGVSYDARLKKLTLTEKSWDFVSKTMEKVDENEEKLRNGLSVEELDSFFRTLEKIKQNLEQ